ncbi:MAG: SAM-dependent DNA methyltransferase [Saprospiraceae bacterium]|nr:SAM-dependent DNA methyltransferase [Saprospiraceae bacterium]
MNIPRNNKSRRGSADTMFNQVIIEFENDLSKTYEHAKKQLAGYLLGQFNSGEGYNYTLIVSDFIHWKVVAPSLEDVENLENFNEEDLELHEDKDASFTLKPDNVEDFYFWLDRFLFKEEKQRATLKRIETSFGHNSSTFIECFRQIKLVLNDAKKFGEIQVSYEQWKKFLSIAYGSFDDSINTFVIHTYLSVFSKILAYGILSNDDFIDDEEMEAVLNGKIFYRYNLNEFVSNDFFHWVHRPRYFSKLKKVFRLITQEISNFDFNNVDEDVLKGVYQELIDIDTRHALGEYYTPDWLCERLTNEIEILPSKKILDPSCGSGSFLRAAIKAIKNQYPTLEANQINDMVYGIDIHPLSVQIAKTTVLISLGKSIANAKKPVRINVILANTLLAPEGVQTLFGGEFKLNIDRKDYIINTQVLNDVQLFDEALQVCDDLAERTKNETKVDKAVFKAILYKKLQYNGINKVVLDGFYMIYTGFKKVKENNRDSIWKFIIQNLYKPYFLNKRFDYVIGNPPWFTFSSVKNEEYQNTLNTLAETYKVKPKSTANYPHLEIAAIFLAYCSKYFLKDDGQILFVLPRSFMNADHHDNTRAGTSHGFKITQVWDLDKVSPLFRVPSCVIIADKAKDESKRSIPAKGIKGLSIEGRLKEHNCNYETAAQLLNEKKVEWYYREQGKSSAFTNKSTKIRNKANPYKKRFKQGATIVPRCFYFVELNQVIPPDFKDRILNLKTAEAIQANAKKPWKGIILKNRIESQFLFRTALSNNIVPFALIDTYLITLPIIIDERQDTFGKKKLICFQQRHY